MTGPTPELAVVVLGVRAPPELRTALESLKRQSVPLEIVVVNSGGGDPYSLVPAGMAVKVVSLSRLLWPGAARNAGIRATRAPWIAFMASDHIASNDWAAARLELHRQGHSAVACAVVNSHPRNLFAWANHLGILVRRLPGVPPRQALCYGASYARSLFKRHGWFSEDLRIGEDTDFNRRLPDADRPVWAPQVRTIHLNPTTFRHMVKNQFERGRRSGLHWPHWNRGPLLIRAYKRFVSIAGISYASVRGVDRVFVVCSWPLLLVCVWAYSIGVSAGRWEGQRKGATGGSGEGSRDGLGGSGGVPASGEGQVH